MGVEPDHHQSTTTNYKIAKPNNTDLAYPLHVFRTAEAYLFFDACARHISSAKMLSFLYRKMMEKNQDIFLRDTAFRAWFNTQDYPITLDYPTDTYERATTKERQEWMAIVEYFNALNK